MNLASLYMLANTVAEDTFDVIFSRWGAVLLESIPSPAFTVLDVQENISTLIARHLTVIGAVNILAVLALGLIAARVVLGPTRDAISAQRNFIAHTAHELRTPLTVARTNLEVALLSGVDITVEECREEFKRTLTELDTLAGIINNLVILNTLTHLEPAEYQYHDLDEVVREVTQSHHKYAERKSITLTLESDPGLVLWSNRNALKQMLGNVIGNAINFSHHGGTVTIRAYRVSARYVRVSITDTGIGIDKDELPLIFKPFYRSPSLTEAHDTGSGLGLAIVRELVRLHSGRITFQSKPGVGTTVLVDLPIIRRRRALFSRSHTHEDSDEVTFNFTNQKEIDRY